jgi:hypothetical protein
VKDAVLSAAAFAERGLALSAANILTKFTPADSSGHEGSLLPGIPRRSSKDKQIESTQREKQQQLRHQPDDQYPARQHDHDYDQRHQFRRQNRDQEQAVQVHHVATRGSPLSPQRYSPKIADAFRPASPQFDDGKKYSPLPKHYIALQRLEKKRYRGPNESPPPSVYYRSDRDAQEAVLGVARRAVEFAFNRDQNSTERPYLEEAERVIELPSKEEVSHMFVDGHDVLDLNNAPEAQRRQVAERSQAMAVHAVMVMHAIVRTNIERLLYEHQDGKLWTPPATIKVAYPPRGEKQ